MYVVVEGLAEARRQGALLWQCGPGDLLGELRLGVAPATATITACTPMRLLALMPRAHGQVFELPGVARWVTTDDPAAPARPGRPPRLAGGAAQPYQRW